MQVFKYTKNVGSEIDISQIYGQTWTVVSCFKVD